MTDSWSLAGPGRSVRFVFINLDQRRARRALMRLQCALHGLHARRVVALDELGGAGVLPDSRLTGGELGLAGTWASILRLEVAGDDEADRWVVILEDDAVLRPRFKRCVVGVLAAAPPECAYVQLGSLRPGAWRRGMKLRRNLYFLVKRLGEQLRRASRNRGEELLVQELRDGTHAHAVRTSAAGDLLDLAADFDRALDVLILDLARTHPIRFMRSSRNLAWQAPFRSDILRARVARQRSPG